VAASKQDRGRKFKETPNKLLFGVFVFCDLKIKALELVRRLGRKWFNMPADARL